MQSANAPILMFVTPVGISYAPEIFWGQQISAVFALLKSTPLASLEYAELFGFTHIPESFAQPPNTPSPILVTLLGMVMLVRLVQSLNAELLISVTPFEMAMSVKPVQLRNASVPMLVTLPGTATLVRPVQR